MHRFPSTTRWVGTECLRKRGGTKAEVNRRTSPDLYRSMTSWRTIVWPRPTPDLPWSDVKNGPQSSLKNLETIHVCKRIPSVCEYWF